MKYHAVAIYAYSLGLLNGCYLCRRFNPFNPSDVSVKRRILRAFIGIIGIILLLKFVFENIIMSETNLKLGVILLFLTGFAITFIYPLIFTRIKSK